MQKQKELVLLAQRIRALSQIGLTYSTIEYDIERYNELLQISDRIVSLSTGVEAESISACYKGQKEYITPKVDIRAVVFDKEGRILLVKEYMDGLWSLPGGWSDIGFTPKEVAVKEVKEETGLDVRAVRLLSVMDMRNHNHPVIPYYVYKFFILCEIEGGEFTETFDILGKGFFEQDKLPPLSLERVLPEQINLMFEYYRNPEKEIYMD